MAEIMRIIMNGKASPAQIGGFLIALHMKGESVTEITAAAKVVRELLTPVHVNGDHLVDIVGTGGDQAHTFNISTTSAFVAAAAGANVAKHNNRAISSQSGSADLLEIAGINPLLQPEQIAQCINQIGIGFMFAPSHHNAWKNVAAPRRELGVRTLFNLLGPLSNPANAPNLLVGVFAKKWVEPFANVLRELGNKHVLVVHSQDGLDEISIAAPTDVAELKNGAITTYTITPELFGIHINPLDSVRVNNPQESFALMQDVLNNKPGPARDIVVLNAGTAIYAANLTDSMAAGVKKAEAALACGGAKEKFDALVKMSRVFRASD